MGIHGALLGLDHGIQQNHPALSPAREVTFRLVPRHIDPSPRPQQNTVMKGEPEIFREAQPPQPETVVKMDPEVTKKSKAQPVPAPVETTRNRRVEQPVPEPEKIVVRETPPVARQVDETELESEVIPVEREPSIAEQPVEATEKGNVEIVMAKPLYRINPPPPYPAKARRRNLEGTVLLEVSVSSTGRVDQLQIRESCGHRILDKAAVKAVRKWVFEPGSRNGLPVSMTVLVPVRFALQ